jgi:hypothetical protein
MTTTDDKLDDKTDGKPMIMQMKKSDANTNNKPYENLDEKKTLPPQDIVIVHFTKRQISRPTFLKVFFS